MYRLRRYSTISVSLLVGLFVIDRLLKYYALYRLPLEGRSMIGDVVRLQLEQNTGVGYGISLPQWLIIGLTAAILLVLVSVIVYAWRRRQVWLVIGAEGIIAGAGSNLIDRVRFGYVVDYLTLSFTPVFNLADVLIIVGAAISIIILFWSRP